MSWEMTPIEELWTRQSNQRRRKLRRDRHKRTKIGMLADKVQALSMQSRRHKDEIASMEYRMKMEREELYDMMRQAMRARVDMLNGGFMSEVITVHCSHQVSKDFLLGCRRTAGINKAIEHMIHALTHDIANEMFRQIVP